MLILIRWYYSTHPLIDVLDRKLYLCIYYCYLIIYLDYVWKIFSYFDRWLLILNRRKAFTIAIKKLWIHFYSIFSNHRVHKKFTTLKLYSVDSLTIEEQYIFFIILAEAHCSFFFSFGFWSSVCSLFPFTCWKPNKKRNC